MLPQNKMIRVLIPDGSSVLALPVARCLATAGFDDVWLRVDDLTTHSWRTRHKRGLLHCEGKPFCDSVLDAIRYCRATVLLPVSEEGIREVALAKHRLKAAVAISPVADLQSFDQARDKALLAQFASKHGIPVPSTRIVDAGTPPPHDLCALGLPVLVKPALSTGGAGISLCKSNEQLSKAINVASPGTRLVVQEFIPGRDVDCSVLCRDGKILKYTIQQSLTRGSTKYAAAGSVEFIEDDQVLKIVSETMRALRFSGVAHCDLRYDDARGGVKLIEINARFWGSLLASLVAGVNFPELAIKAALDEPLPEHPYELTRFQSAGVAIKNLFGRRRTNLSIRSIIRNSDLWFRIKDPLPDLSILWGRVRPTLSNAA